MNRVKENRLNDIVSTRVKIVDEQEPNEHCFLIRKRYVKMRHSENTTILL